MTEILLAWLLPTIGAWAVLYVHGTLPVPRRWRQFIAEAAAGLLLASGVFLCLTDLTILPKTLALLVQLWSIVLAARLSFGRLNEEFLRASTRRNVAITGAFLAGVLLMDVSAIEAQTIWQVLVFLSLAVALAFTIQTIWTLKHYRLRNFDPHIQPKDLPTVTLAIPARNETHALANCLIAAVESDYPKLEILVVDDCSQDKTSDIIRTFAHDGARFIQGDVPDESWLGKNFACRALAEQAEGEYIIFAGVDTHLSPQSVTRLVNYALSHDLAMVSVLARRRDGIHGATLVQQLRYYWQIVLPITRHRVPVASQCWLIKTDALRQLGGFAAVKQKIIPEGSFARRLATAGLYRFIISDDALGITTAKKWSSQNETALRILYPTFKRQPFYVLIGVLMLAGVILLPFALLVSAWGQLVWWVALVTCALLLGGYALVVMRTHPRTWPLTLLCFVPSLMLELGLLVLSMMLYEFAEVNWKGRNVCYPVIAPVSSLSVGPVSEPRVGASHHPA